MNEDSTGLEKLRKKAEANLKKIPTVDSLTPKEINTLLHELHVYQEELEMQNQELREMQHRLEIVRDQYTDLFDFAPVGYFILDSKGVIVNVNLTGCHLLGMDRIRLKGKPFSVFAAKGNDDGNNFYLYLRAIFASASINSIDLLLKKADGTPFPAQLEGVKISHEADNPDLCRVTLRDISHEKRTAMLEQLNQQLKQEKETARQYLEMAGVVFLALDLEGNITMINQKGCEILGYKIAKNGQPGLTYEEAFRSMTSLNWIETFFAEKDRNFVLDSYEKLKKNAPGIENIEIDIQCIDGEVRTISWHNTVLRDHSGKITGVLTAGTDISIRKREEEKLKQALTTQQQTEKRFRDIFENANDAISIIDAASLRIVNANSKMLNRLGYTSNELTKLKVNELYDHHAAGEISESLLKDMYLNNQVLFEAVQISKNGAQIPVEVNSCLIEYEGKPAFLSISRDISERKKVESMLMANLLEGQEKERQRIAIDLHDSIQPLLATIKRKLEILDPAGKTKISEKIKEYSAATSLLDKTLKEIRTISHNLVPPTLKDFGLIATLRDLCESMDQPGKIKIIFFSDGMDSDNDINYHVATGLYRIAQELLYNSIKHSKAKLITLQLVRHRKSCVLMIEDDGIGFKEPHNKKGLGINSMSARVKMMDGTFDIDSLEGRGTIITVEVPLAEIKN